MKKTRLDYLKIILTILIIVGLFMPYIYDVLPFEIIFERYMDLEGLFALTIPILVIIPFILIFIFKRILSDTLIKALKVIFLILYIMVLVDYGYGFYDSLDLSFFNEKIPFIVSMVLSLLLIFLNFKYATPNSEQLENILLATIGFPILLYFTYGITNDLTKLNYGSYIISISFITLYIMAVFKIYKNRILKSN